MLFRSKMWLNICAKAQLDYTSQYGLQQRRNVRLLSIRHATQQSLMSFEHRFRLGLLLHLKNIACPPIGYTLYSFTWHQHCLALSDYITTAVS